MLGRVTMTRCHDAGLFMIVLTLHKLRDVDVDVEKARGIVDSKATGNYVPTHRLTPDIQDVSSFKDPKYVNLLSLSIPSL